MSGCTHICQIKSARHEMLPPGTANGTMRQSAGIVPVRDGRFRGVFMLVNRCTRSPSNRLSVAIGARLCCRLAAGEAEGRGPRAQGSPSAVLFPCAQNCPRIAARHGKAVAIRPDRPSPAVCCMPPPLLLPAALPLGACGRGVATAHGRRQSHPRRWRPHVMS